MCVACKYNINVTDRRNITSKNSRVNGKHRTVNMREYDFMPKVRDSVVRWKYMFRPGSLSRTIITNNIFTFGI